MSAPEPPGPGASGESPSSPSSSSTSPSPSPPSPVPPAPQGEHGHEMAWATNLVKTFIDSKLTPLVILFSVVLGAFAVLRLPREEEPQIKVPIIDIFVSMEGASPEEVEQRVTRPMEKLLWEIPGVEYVYSTSSTALSFVVVRFEVGQDEEDAIVRVNQKMAMHFDIIPPGAGRPLIKPRSIDDVPVLAITLWSPERGPFELRRIAAEVADVIKAAPGVAETTLIGGQRREMRIALDPARLAARGVSPLQVASALEATNARSRSGTLDRADGELLVETGGFLRDAEDVGRVVVGESSGRPIHLSEVATVTDGPAEAVDHVFFEPGPAYEPGGHERGGLHADGADPKSSEASGRSPEGAAPSPGLGRGGTLERGPFPAVTISVAKRKGTNAITVVGDVLGILRGMEGQRLPADVEATITRNYGETAREKSDELLLHMGIAVISVTILIWLFLGWRESGIVAIAIPVTLALTLTMFFLLGYSLNRITLFALIFSIGILVDDPIVDVENIVRHFRMSSTRGRSLLAVTIEAVNEVRSPLILATLTVICAVLPMAFVRGLMGPYMRPIPIGASAAMVVSMLVALIITPWAAHRILRGPTLRGTLAAHDHGGEEGLGTRLYRTVMGRLISSRGWRGAFLGLTALLLLGAVALVPLERVVVKMLPFDNKGELQVIIDMPEGTTLEATTNVARELAAALKREPEVTDIEVYAGTAAPYNFNGLVRHYFLRRGANVADLQANLVGKHERVAQSHDFARRVRAGLEAIAQRRGARIKIAEVPPGPPVLQTIVGEVYHPDPARRLEMARKLKALFESTEGVVDIDWYEEDDQPLEEVRVDAEKAALHGVSVESVHRTLRAALEGLTAGLLHDERAKEDVPLVLRLPRAQRAVVDDALSLRVEADRPGLGGRVPLRELVRIEQRTAPRSIYHKNLLPVIYVTGDVHGREESPVYAILKLREKLASVAPEVESGGTEDEVGEYWLGMPFGVEGGAVKWDGEMHITMEVFRDLGLAFAMVLVLMYVLVVGWFRSFTTPIVIMAAIPFSLVGILPAHWLMGAFFTATSMIGFIAGAGIVVRNSIILVDFIELRLREGVPLADAVVDAGAVRFRPMLLTAAAVMAGAGVILFDPIFQGLALSLIAGEVASLLLSRMAVPVFYYMRFKGKRV